MTFPLIGSAVLLGLFLLFKFLPQELVNTVLTAYFVLIGIFAITVTIAPFVALVFPRSTRSREFKLPSFSIPYFLQANPNSQPPFSTLPQCSVPKSLNENSKLLLPTPPPPPLPHPHRPPPHSAHIFLHNFEFELSNVIIPYLILADFNFQLPSFKQPVLSSQRKKNVVRHLQNSRLQILFSQALVPLTFPGSRFTRDVQLSKMCTFTQTRCGGGTLSFKYGF
jgi:hypothetical protein